MPHLLITGGAGFIGANFVRYWRNRHPEDAITIVDALTYAGNPANIEGVPGVHLFVEDIRNTQAMEALLAERSIDTIVHFAAESHVDRSIDGPDAFIETNVIGTHSLLKAAKSVWLDRAAVFPIASITSRRTRSMAASARTTPPSPKPLHLRRIRHIRRRRPPATTSSAPITTLMACRRPRAIARTITAHISFRKS